MKKFFYPTWYAMMKRCYSPSNHNYKRYGARGITVCEEWHNYKCFELWANSTYPAGEQKLTLDRIDNDKDYCPANCRWVTMKTQSNNRRSNTFYTLNGETKTFTEWCNYYQISDDVVWERINKLGWEIQKAFSTPLSLQSSKTRYITHNGETHNLTEWCKITGVPHSTVYARIKRGIDPLVALELKNSK